MHFLNAEQVKRALMLAFAADVPTSIWGPPGVGKSAIVEQLAHDMRDEDDKPYRLYDLRLSDKEPSDVGGIPYPMDDPNKENKMKKVLEFLVTDLLPFDTNVRAIVLLDEFDRADLSVQNVALQIILDRKVNGHWLSPLARIVLAGNGATDVGTSPLSRAAANRICHLYIETGSKEALKGWLGWAEKNEISPILQGFAGYRQEVFGGIAAKGKVNIEELAYPTPRSFVYADKLVKMADKVNFPTEDILPAMVAGCVGKAAAAEFMGFRDIFNKLPTPDQILANPESVQLPTNPSVLYAFKRALATAAATNIKVAEAVAKYALRWDDEPAGDMFRLLKEKQPEIVNSDLYKAWQIKRERPPLGNAVPQATPTAASFKAWCMKCRKQTEILNPLPTTMKNGKPAMKGDCSSCSGPVITLNMAGTGDGIGSPVSTIPILNPTALKIIADAVGGKIDHNPKDTTQHTNHMKVKSSTGINTYTVSQKRSTGGWECSCRGWTSHRNCKHLDAIGAAINRAGAQGNAVQLNTNPWRSLNTCGRRSTAEKHGQREIRRGRATESRVLHTGNYKFQTQVR
jgi:hypothetical protein